LLTGLALISLQPEFPDTRKTLLVCI